MGTDATRRRAARTSPQIPLRRFVADFADALLAVDRTGPVGRSSRRVSRPGVGPLQERQAIRLAAAHLARTDPAYTGIASGRYPGSSLEADLVIPGQWALELKMARPFSDDDRPSDHWSENLLHPYAGTTSAVGDALKLQSLGADLSKAVVIYGFEHAKPRISLEPAVRAFELIATKVAGVRLGRRVEEVRIALQHPAHAVVRVYGWEVLAG
ncbi:MAG: hypothetical protein ACXWWQ_00160 [Candidatus Limnocylindria bacterium]